MKLTLTPVEREHMEWLLRWRNNPALNIYFNQVWPLSMAMQNEWYENQVMAGKTFAYLIMLEDVKVGYAALQNVNWVQRSAEISHFVIEGYNWEMFSLFANATLLRLAFQGMNLHRVHTVCFDMNPVKEILVKLGFKLEGTIRDYTFKNGEYHNGLLMSILDHEHKAILERLQQRSVSA